MPGVIKSSVALAMKREFIDMNETCREGCAMKIRYWNRSRSIWNLEQSFGSVLEIAGTTAEGSTLKETNQNNSRNNLVIYIDRRQNFLQWDHISQGRVIYNLYREGRYTIADIRLTTSINLDAQPDGMALTKSEEVVRSNHNICEI